MKLFPSTKSQENRGSRNLCAIRSLASQFLLHITQCRKSNASQPISNIVRNIMTPRNTTELEHLLHSVSQLSSIRTMFQIILQKNTLVTQIICSNQIDLLTTTKHEIIYIDEIAKKSGLLRIVPDYIINCLMFEAIPSVTSILGVSLL